MNNPIRVIIVDDLEPIQQRFKRILSKNGEIDVVATASSGYEAIALAAIHHPDIILMDIEMEDKYAGINASKQISEKFPNTKIIILTVHKDDEFILFAYQAGVVDYLFKNATPEEIINAIVLAFNNSSPIRPQVAEKIRKEFQRLSETENSMLYILNIVTQLTPAEIVLLELFSQGKTRKEIAKIRCVEESTIKSQINALLKKFDKHSTKEVVRILNKHKILDSIIKNL